jgi:hypothetical protein
MFVIQLINDSLLLTQLTQLLPEKRSCNLEAQVGAQGYGI